MEPVFFYLSCNEKNTSNNYRALRARFLPNLTDFEPKLGYFLFFLARRRRFFWYFSSKERFFLGFSWFWEIPPKSMIFFRDDEKIAETICVWFFSFQTKKTLHGTLFYHNLCSVIIQTVFLMIGESSFLTEITRRYQNEVFQSKRVISSGWLSPVAIRNRVIMEQCLFFSFRETKSFLPKKIAPFGRDFCPN